jgi:hypothetical protein
MRIIQSGPSCWVMLLFWGALELSAQDSPVVLSAATVGEHYEHALKTTKPARFFKSSGNTPWLAVTAEGVLTGTPGSDAPAMSEITVDACPLNSTCDSGSRREPLRRTFVVPVRMIACASRNKNEFSWCDESATQSSAPLVAEQTRSVVLQVTPESETPAAQPAQPNSSATAQEVRPARTDRASFGPRSSAVQTQKSVAPQSVIIENAGNATMSRECSGAGCIVQFDRLRTTPNEFGLFNPATHSIDWGHASFGNSTRDTVVNAVNASKVFLSGSVWIHDRIKNCSYWSWSVVTQTRDSSNNLYYGPSDLTAFCVDKNSVTNESTALIVLPVQAIWASVYGTSPNTNDPTWKLTKEPPQAHECNTGDEDPVGKPPKQGIMPCDKLFPDPSYPDEASSAFLRHVLYSPFVERLYTRGALPGVSQGSITIAPIALATKSTFDVQIYESWLQGRGWIGFQGMYEHDRKPQDDLNSLTAAVTYDLRIRNSQPFWVPRYLGTCETSGNCPPPVIGLRPPEFILRVGPEWSPDAFKPATPKGGGMYPDQYLPRNTNVVMGSTLRLPFVFSPETGYAPRQPSELTVSPVVGFEGGFRVKSHEIGLGTVCPAPLTLTPCTQQPEDIFRRVAGIDASGRWPYSLTRNFLGDRPVIMDFSYRRRWLTYAEPFANWKTITNSVNTYEVPAEGQSTEGRAYTRITLIEPFSAYFQLRVVWQRGALPPAYQYVHNLVAIGVTFSNPGSSEH